MAGHLRELTEATYTKNNIYKAEKLLVILASRSWQTSLHLKAMPGLSLKSSNYWKVQLELLRSYRY